MLTHECKGNASYKHLSIKQENIDLYYKNKPRIFATVPQRDNFKKQLVQSQKELLELSNRKILTSQNEKSLLEIAFRKSEVYRLFHETSNNTDTEIQNKDWKELRKEIDTTYSNFTAQLYALYPQISELELHICYLIKISMPVKDIARLVGRSTPAITASRIRLYKKIHGTEGTAEMMDKFIADL